MSNTPNLGLPFIVASQAQKEVTHNSGLQILDAIVQLTVNGFQAAPPASPEDGERYVVAASPTGAWVGKEGYIAAYYGGAWVFVMPVPGWMLTDISDGGIYTFIGDGAPTAPTAADWQLRLGSAAAGWVDATGTKARTTFSTSTVTTAQLAQRVAALIDDLKAAGIISA